MPNRIGIVRGLMTIALLTGTLARLPGRIDSNATQNNPEGSL
jgi:hypothetical protein